RRSHPHPRRLASPRGPPFRRRGGPRRGRFHSPQRPPGRSVTSLVASRLLLDRAPFGAVYPDRAPPAQVHQPFVGRLMGSAIAQDVLIEIGAMPVLVRTSSPEFLHILRERYGGFVNSSAQPVFEFEVEIVQPGTIPTAIGDDEVLSVRFDAGRWVLQRGDFRAELDPSLRHGRIWQSLNPYAIDAAFRIVHSLLLAKQGGLLVHASSVVRNGHAFLFAGVSGAGKTTIARLAPADVTLLTDEISYVRKRGDAYVAYGTPFTGELAKLGENTSAPLSALYL